MLSSIAAAWIAGAMLLLPWCKVNVRSLCVGMGLQPSWFVGIVMQQIRQLNIHEMVQFSDGRIGTKWMEEIIPATEKESTIAEEINDTTTYETESESFLLTFDVDPAENISGKLGALFLGEEGDENACEFQVSPHAKRAQYGQGNLAGFSAPEKSLREGGIPQKTRHYGIENLLDTDKPFSVRMFVKYDSKYGGSQIDTEIAGKRTMITFCPNLKVDKLLFRTEDTGIKNVKIASYIPTAGGE